MVDVVKKLWSFCDYLRDDGITYGDYIEQLTYLLFLKMANEKGRPMPEGTDWSDLIRYSGSELLDHYANILSTLAKHKGMLGDIFAQSLSKFTNSANLKKLLNLINEIEWTLLDIDVKAAAYEGLLEKYASEEKGAGQYFTPRVIIRSIIRCVKPEFQSSHEYSVHDPACGTGGFLIGAFEWIMKMTNNGAKLTIKDRERLVKRTLSGMDNVQGTRRLALMNCYLHELEATVYYGDSLGQGQHVGRRYDLVLTNPPFGKGASGIPSRSDFLFSTTNKQLNFVQHCITITKSGGQVAMVVPDNVLFDRAGRDVREHLLKYCDLHTILRLPEGTFSPYSSGVKANVIFFKKGTSTREVWIYDLRTNINSINKGNPLTSSLFEEFECVYHLKPRNDSVRFKVFTRKDIEARNYNLDIFWLEHNTTDFEIPDPYQLADEAARSLELALKSIKEIQNKLEEGLAENIVR
jgi:type I restriction enzyme M protein